MPKIVVSYRRADASGTAGRIFDRLANNYGKSSVFMDIDNIPFGVDFRKHIEHALDDCDALIAVIGPRWTGSAEGATSRIKNVRDIVRLEIESAIKKEIPLFPVLVEGAEMPGPDDLPDSLHDFSFLNAAPVESGRDFDMHVARLVRHIDMRIEERAAEHARQAELASAVEAAAAEARRQERAQREAEDAERRRVAVEQATAAELARKTAEESARREEEARAAKAAQAAQEAQRVEQERREAEDAERRRVAAEQAAAEALARKAAEESARREEELKAAQAAEAEQAAADARRMEREAAERRRIAADQAAMEELAKRAAERTAKREAEAKAAEATRATRQAEENAAEARRAEQAQREAEDAERKRIAAARAAAAELAAKAVDETAGRDAKTKAAVLPAEMRSPIPPRGIGWVAKALTVAGFAAVICGIVVIPEIMTKRPYVERMEFLTTKYAAETTPFLAACLGSSFTDPSACSDLVSRGLLPPESMSVIHHRRGLIYANQKDPAPAIVDLYRAIQLDPKSAEAYYSRGMMRQDFGLAGAEDDFAKAIALGRR